ncbi:hypothetical protein [Pseudomonas sp. B21-048]|uniref:hypothetical protein n=1 Tax=Pseudomonas sp. B21-048 TaxID=2895490 RepID=UPI00215E350A|nr:hypothetical protein [Pseudomonas sp. B21-048]UVK99868.1 hypothetical protein LOY56_05605 [Pseudomonas sp. B21-048]
MSIFALWLTVCNPIDYNGKTEMHCSSPSRMPTTYFKLEDCEKAKKHLETDPYALSFDAPGSKNKYACKEAKA